MISLYGLKKIIDVLDGALANVYADIDKISDDFDKAVIEQSKNVADMKRSGNYSEKFIREKADCTKTVNEAFEKRSKVSNRVIKQVEECADMLKGEVYACFAEPGSELLSRTMALVHNSGMVLSDGELDALFRQATGYFDAKSVQTLAINQIEADGSIDKISKGVRKQGAMARYPVPDIAEVLRRVDEYSDYAKRIAEHYAGSSRFSMVYSETLPVPAYSNGLRESEAFVLKYRLEEALTDVYKSFGERFSDGERQRFKDSLNKVKQEERANRDAHDSVISPLYRTLAEKVGEYDLEGAKLAYKPYSRPGSIRVDDMMLPKNLWYKKKGGAK